MSASATRVLVLDDDEDVAYVTCELLAMEGYDAIAAHTVEQAMKSVRTSPPAVVLVDYDLTDGTGTDFVRQVKALNGPQVALVAVSGWSYENERVAEFGRMCDRWFSKPGDWPAITLALRELVHHP